MLKDLSGRSSFPNEMLYQDRLAGSDMEKANIFNIFFHSVYKQTSLSVAPIYTQSANIHLGDLVFTISQTVKLLETLPMSTNAVADAIPPFVLKYCSASLGPLIHSLFSRIIFTCKRPRLWKCAFVTRIHKKVPEKLSKTKDQYRCYLVYPSCWKSLFLIFFTRDYDTN